MDERLKINISQKSEVWLLVFKGPLDEFAEFPAASGKAAILCDLSGITHVNSLGVNAWCEWLAKQKDRTSVILEKCPTSMVRQFSIVRSALAKNTVVESFFVPYMSPT